MSSMHAELLPGSWYDLKTERETLLSNLLGIMKVEADHAVCILTKQKPIYAANIHVSKDCFTFHLLRLLYLYTVSNEVSLRVIPHDTKVLFLLFGLLRLLLGFSTSGKRDEFAKLAAAKTEVPLLKQLEMIPLRKWYCQLIQLHSSSLVNSFQQKGIENSPLSSHSPFQSCSNTKSMEVKMF